MPHVRHISTKWRQAIEHLGTIPACIFYLGLEAKVGAWQLTEPRFDSAIVQSLDAVFQMQYSQATKQLQSIPETEPARPYFMGLVYMHQFSDLGDTTALLLAKNEWERLSPKEKKAPFHGEYPSIRLYRGLAGLQLSYIATLRGEKINSATLALSARRQLLKVSDATEANAALALFDYYRNRFLEKLSFIPFVNPNPQVALQKLKISSEQSPYLKDVLSASLFWIYFDQNQCDSSLLIVKKFLQRYPKNRTVRQMQGDALFRQGKLLESETIYSQLLHEYTSLHDSLPKNIPLGVICASGNLARITAKLGKKVESQAHLKKWKNAKSENWTPWLPSSLKREVAKLESQ